LPPLSTGEATFIPECCLVVPTENPFEEILKINTKQTKAAATRAEAYALARALKEMGEPHLGAAALICFEWASTPRECSDRQDHLARLPLSRAPQSRAYLSSQDQEIVLQPLEYEGRKLYPELEDYLAVLPPVGVAIVVTKGFRGPSRPHAIVYAQAKVREAGDRAGLGSHVTLDACRMVG
jgi:hypothetical protein